MQEEAERQHSHYVQEMFQVERELTAQLRPLHMSFTSFHALASLTTCTNRKKGSEASYHALSVIRIVLVQSPTSSADTQPKSY